MTEDLKRIHLQRVRHRDQPLITGVIFAREVQENYKRGFANGLSGNITIIDTSGHGHTYTMGPELWKHWEIVSDPTLIPEGL